MSITLGENSNMAPCPLCGTKNPATPTGQSSCARPRDPVKGAEWDRLHPGDVK